MGIHVIKMPDIGEGIAEVELVGWHVKPGDTRRGGPAAGRRDDRQGHRRDSVVGRRHGDLARRQGRRCDGRRLRVDPSRSRGRGQPEGGRCSGGRAPRARSCAGSRAAARRGRSAAASRAGAGSAPRGTGAGGLDARAARAGGQADRVAGRAWPRLGTGHRTAVRAGQRPRGSHPAGGPRCVSRPPRHPGDDGRALRRASRRGAGAGHRPAPQDRAEDAGGKAAHPALHLRRGDRRHRAGGPARAAERAPRDRARQADAAAAAGPRDRAGAARLPPDQCPLRRRRRHRDPLWGSAPGRRDADRRWTDGPGAAPRRSARSVVHRRGDPAARRGGAQRQGRARRTHGFDDHASPAWGRSAASSRPP